MKEISFKSNRENFNKELHGIKCNTFRRIDWEDMRFTDLEEMKDSGKYGIIEITCDDSCFKRQIKDITIYLEWIIISWDNPDVIRNNQEFIQKLKEHFDHLDFNDMETFEEYLEFINKLARKYLKSGKEEQR